MNKMDLSEMMKTMVAKGLQPDGTPGSSSGPSSSSGNQGASVPSGAAGPSSSQGSAGSSGTTGHAGPPNVSGSSASASQVANSSTPYPNPGYVTEKLYMLLQVYLQNKGWNQPIEFHQAFADMKDTAMPNAAYLQMMASRVALDSNGRLVHRENGKIILPFEHFANAVMLKHISGPHGLHLGLEATIRAVMESYTIGREQFGMEKEFIVEVVQNCPNPTCRYYKNQMHMGSSSQQYHQMPDSSGSGSNRVNQQVAQTLADAANLVRGSSGGGGNGGNASVGKGSSAADFLQGNLNLASLMGSAGAAGAAGAAAANSNASRDSAAQNGALLHNQLHSQLHPHNQLHGLDRDAAAQILKSNLSLDLANTSINDLKTVGAMLELSRAKAAAAAANANRSSTPAAASRAQLLAVAQQQLLVEKVARSLQQEGLLAENAARSMQQDKQQQQQLQHLQQQQLHHQQMQQQQQLQQQQLQQQQQIHIQLQQLQQQQKHHHQSVSSASVTDHKLADFLRANLENVENMTGSTKDLLALHNGAWSSHDDLASYKRSACSEAVGQEKIVRAFQEIMKNMHRMKTYVRPSMCKPYGKQSEMLQKTLEDTLLLVQALRSLLPPPQY